ncbi:MAG: phosphatidate cytidylyltransferase [Spirochaetaceae bacterium]|nr:MAG: phosphatidate cytidylyltransferase [Spirochaetaceae bacterium]
MVTGIGLSVIVLVALVLLLVFNELVYRRLGLKGEFTRKFAHLCATLTTIIFPYLFDDHWYVLALAIVFFVLLYGSRNRAYLKSIHDVPRLSSGSYLLPPAIYLTFLAAHLLEDRFFFILPILVLAICDPVAGILGINLQQYNRRIRIFGHKLHKTWLGSGAFFVSCLLISVVGLYFRNMQLDLELLGIAVLVAATGTVVEMLSCKGVDNLLIPMSVLAVLLLTL